MTSIHKACFGAALVVLLFSFSCREKAEAVPQSDPEVSNEDDSLIPNKHWKPIFDSEDPLDNNINHILQRSNGSVWVATSGGLYSYQNGDWSEQVAFFGDAEIYQLHEDHTGRFWVTASTGTAYWQDGWKKFTVSIYFHDDIVYRVFRSTDGDLFYAGDYDLRVDYKTGEDYTYGMREVNEIMQDRNGKVWIVGETGLHYYDQTVVRGDYFPEEEKFRDLTSVYEDRLGNLWLTTKRDGLYHYDGQDWVNYKSEFRVGEKYPLASNDTKDILEDNQGNMWIATKNGLNRWSFSDEWTTFDEYNTTPEGQKQGLPSDMINCLFIDSQKQLWVGTAKGIHAYIP